MTSGETNWEAKKIVDNMSEQQGQKLNEKIVDKSSQNPGFNVDQNQKLLQNQGNIGKDASDKNYSNFKFNNQ
jgi:hypothetical protein